VRGKIVFNAFICSFTARLHKRRNFAFRNWSHNFNVKPGIQAKWTDSYVCSVCVCRTKKTSRASSVVRLKGRERERARERETETENRKKIYGDTLTEQED
jgi:hypothetical protein